MAQRHPHPGWWSLTLYPDAGEASGSFHASIRRGALGKGAGRAEPERAKREAERRAAAKLRRYCSANHLDRLGTLTYAEPCFDTKQMRGHVGGFFKRLKRELGGNPFPYAWVREWHPSGHGLHVHFAVGRYVPYAVVGDAWGRGIVDIRRVTVRRAGDATNEAAKTAARYLAKYVGKSTDSEKAVAGNHRFEVAQGFQPRSVQFFDRSPEAVIERASAEMLGRPTYVWHSAGDLLMTCET